jgi:hypothetical protein
LPKINGRTWVNEQAETTLAISTVNQRYNGNAMALKRQITLKMASVVSYFVLKVLVLTR